MDSKVLIAIAAAVIVVGAGCGVYLMMGGEEAKESILSITEPGTYENGTYSKVIISAAVGDGDVTLKGLKILGALIIRGGGSHSVTLDGCTNQGTTTVEKEGGEDVRINLVNTTLPTVQATSNVILEADSDSGFTNVTLAGANATVQGSDTKVGSVAMGNDTALTVNEGTVVAVDVPAETNATVQAAADGTVQTANVAGNLTVDGADTTIGNVNMQNDSALTVQNGSVDNVNIPSQANVNVGMTSDGNINTATVGDNVSITPSEGTDMSTVSFEMSNEATENSVKVGESDIHAHKLIGGQADWNTFDKDSMTVSATYHCDSNDCTAVSNEVIKVIPVSMDIASRPTCTENGSIRYYTDIPGDNGYMEVIDKLGHALVHHDAKNATCTEVGWNAFDKCSRCDYTTYQEIPALGHNYVIETVMWATLDTENKTVTVVMECDRCAESTVGHTQSRTASVQKEVTPATCTNAGRTHYYVPNTVDNGYDVPIEALGHDTVHHDAKAPTCTEVGWEAYDTCSRCDYSTYHEISATGHDWVDVPAQEPTMDSEGWNAHRECRNCHETDGKVIIPKLHGYTVTVYGGKVAKDDDPLTVSTITVGDGTKVHIEYDGGDCHHWTSNRSDYIPGNSFDAIVHYDLYFTPHPATDKVYGEWVKTPVTCINDGLWYRESTDGEWREWISIPAQGHVFHSELVVVEQPSCTEPGSGYRVCSVCGEHVEEEIPATGHDYVKGDVVQQPAGINPGKISNVCSHCDDEILTDFYKPTYIEIPDGNTVYLRYTNSGDVMNAVGHREETHTVWTIDDNGVHRQAYLYGVKLYSESGSYAGSRDVTSWFLWIDHGDHSPVYLARVNQANDAAYDTWAVVCYVDSKEQFIDFIDGMNLGHDNGRSASLLYALYRSWTDELNKGMASLYETGESFEFRGKTVTPHFNDDGAFWVDENNCCLYRAFGSGYYADLLQVKSIGQEDHLPFEYDYVPVFYKNVEYKPAVYGFFANIPTLGNSMSHCVTLINGTFETTDWAAPHVPFFDAEDLNNVFHLAAPYQWISSDTLEVQGLDGTWYPLRTASYQFDGKSYRGLQIGGLVTNPVYPADSLGYLYEYMVQTHPDNFVMPGDPLFKGIILRFAPETYPLSDITVNGGHIREFKADDEGIYHIGGNLQIYLINDEIYGKKFSHWEVNIDGVIDQLDGNYYTIVPGTSPVITPVYTDIPVHRITLSAGEGGLVNTELIECLEESEYYALAIPEPGYIFKEWWDNVNGYAFSNNRELIRYGYGDESYTAHFVPVDFVSTNPYTMNKVTITNGFLQVDNLGTLLTAVYASEPNGQSVYIVEDPTLGEIYRWDCAYDATGNPEPYTMSPDDADWTGRINVKYAGALTTVVGVFTADITFYDVTVDSCDGNQPITERIAEGTRYRVPAAPQWEGHDFVNWTTESDGTGNSYNPYDTIVIEDSVTLYAQWTLKTSQVSVTIPSSINYQFYNITQQKINVTYGQPALIPAGIVTDLKGLTITGWSYNYNAEPVTVAADGTGTVPYGVTKIVAVCSYITYTIHFDKNSGAATGEMEDRTFQVKDMSSGKYINVSKPYGFTRTGYKISGWTCNGSDVVSSDNDREVSLNLQALVLANPDSAATFEMKAQWSSISYRIFYNTTNQNTSFGTTSAYFNGSDAQWYIMDQNGVFNGANTYYLIGWTAKQDGSGTVFANPVDSAALIALSDSQYRITLYAKWAVKAYTVEFYDDPESQTPVATQNLQYGAGPTALTSVDSMVKEGCTFVGWDTDPSANNVVYQDGATVSDLVTDGSAFKLYAVWIHSSYTVHFDKNAQDATGEMDDQTFAANEEKKLSECGFSYTGYHIDHWCTVPHNQGVDYAVNLPYSNITTEESITLYAIWFPNE